MIHKLRMGNLRHSEFLGFHDNLLSIIMQNSPITLKVGEAMADYSKKIHELEELYEIDAFNPITIEIEELSHQRDEIYTGIVGLVTAHTHNFIPAMKEAAHILQRDLEKHNVDFVRASHTVETTHWGNIIADWRTKPELYNAVDVLGILYWIDELERVNQLFQSKYMARIGSYDAKPHETAMYKRKEVVAAYDLLCKYLNSYSFLNDTPEYRTTISEINALTDQFCVVLKQRRAKTAKNTESIS